MRGLYDLTLRNEFIIESARLRRENPGSGYGELAGEVPDRANLEAGAIIEQAGTQAAAMIEEARRQAAEEANEIKTAAAREGYELGYQSALDEARQEAEKIRNEARRVLKQAEETRRQKLEHLKDEILALAVEMAEKIVTRELETRPDAVLSIAEEAILLAGSREQVVLWVNPAEMEICQARRDRLAALLPPRAELQIMTDETIEPGGCVVENEYGRVDARLSARWRNLLASLKEEAE